MSIKETIQYGAAELKRVYNRNLGMALGISIGVHLLLIGMYVVGLNIGKSDEDSKRSGINRTKLITIAPPPPTENVPPPPPPPMIPPQLMTGSGDGGGVASRAGNPVPVPDAVIAPDVKDFATTTDIAVATPEGGTGGGFGAGDDGAGLGTPVTIDAPVDIKAPEKDPSPDEFLPVESMPDFSMEDLLAKIKYPEIARKNNIEGKVQVQVLVDKTGRVKDFKIVQSDNSIFDNAAKEAVQKTVFKPAIQNGQPVTCWIAFPIEFVLR